MRSFLISTAIIFCILQNSFLVGDDLTEIIPDAERQALIALYKSTNGDRWKNHDNWLGPSGSECTWSGIHCAPDVSTQGEVHWHVYGIDLLKNNLVGTLPSEFDNLGELEELLLIGNQLSGTLPPKLLERFDNGQIRFLGYAGQFSPIVEIEFEFSPVAIICNDFYAVLKSDGSVTLKTKICRDKTAKDRATFWETKIGFLDRYTGDFDRLARMIERFGFYEM